jgi:hypothetical protein
MLPEEGLHVEVPTGRFGSGRIRRGDSAATIGPSNRLGSDRIGYLKVKLSTRPGADVQAEQRAYGVGSCVMNLIEEITGTSSAGVI